MSEDATNGTSPGGTAPATGSVLEELVEALVAPARAFEALRARNAWAHGAILALLTLVIVVALRGLLEPFVEANLVLALKQAAAKGKPMPAEAVGMAGKFAWWGFVSTTTLAVPGAALASGVALWLVAKLFGAPLRFGRAVVIGTLSGIAIPIGMLVVAVQGAVLDPAAIRGFTDATLGPARFMDPATAAPALLALVSRLDLLSLWGALLHGIGVSVMAGVSRATGMLVALTAWGAVTILATLAALFA